MKPPLQKIGDTRAKDAEGRVFQHTHNSCAYCWDNWVSSGGRMCIDGTDCCGKPLYREVVEC